MNKRIVLVITTIVLVLSTCLVYTNVKATPEIEYDIVAVKSVTTTHSLGKEINTWNIEYDGNIYIYTDLNYPVTTRYLLADVSKDHPIILCDIQTKYSNEDINIIARTDVTVGVVRQNKDGEVVRNFEIVEYNDGFTAIYKDDIDDEFDYISYKDVKCDKEDMICTICNMETTNFKPDDIINRVDKVIIEYEKEK